MHRQFKTTCCWIIWCEQLRSIRGSGQHAPPSRAIVAFRSYAKFLARRTAALSVLCQPHAPEGGVGPTSVVFGWTGAAFAESQRLSVSSAVVLVPFFMNGTLQCPWRMHACARARARAATWDRRCVPRIEWALPASPPVSLACVNASLALDVVVHAACLCVCCTTQESVGPCQMLKWGTHHHCAHELRRDCAQRREQDKLVSNTARSLAPSRCHHN